jgi:predicted MFS family arabinose efflux permease
MQACVGMFNLFFVEEISMTLKQYGHINAYVYGISVLLTYPAGLVADKYHPLRVEIIMIFILVLMGPFNLIYLYFDMSPQTVYSYYFTVVLISMPARALYVASQLPMYMRLFPKERFGQFCSAQAMICSIGTILGSLIAGALFDWLKWHYNGSNYAYRWVPAWIWVVQILGFLCIIQVYRGWKHYGGMNAYVPPLPEKQFTSDKLVDESISPSPKVATLDD